MDEDGNPLKKGTDETAAAFLGKNRTQELRDFYLSGEKANKVAERLGVTTDANVGKFDAFYTSTGKAKTRVDKMRESVDLLAQSRINIGVELNGYERAMLQISTLQNAATAVPTAGLDNGVTFQHGGTPNVNPRSPGGVNFNGPITVQAQDPTHFVRELERRNRRRGHGGFSG